MIRRALARTFLGIALLAAALPALAQLPFAPVQGQLVDGRSGQFAPGLTVSLIHPVLGRSAPVMSDGVGRFGWNAIPIRPEPYFLEVYWGTNLIFRQQIWVNAPNPVMLPPIRL
jgi:hypothetical protein